MLITVNGAVVEENAPEISPLDRGLLLGDGIFETLRIYAGRAFMLHRHMDRLASSAAQTGIELPANLEALVSSEIDRARISGLHDAYVRITLTRGNGLGLATQPSSPTLITIVDALPSLQESWYSNGIYVTTASGRKNEFSPSAGIKTTAYLDSILAFREAALAHCDDAVFIDTQGHLSEATASNLFLVADGAVLTPPLDCGALPGITREAVLEIAGSLGLATISDRELPPANLSTAHEAFLTSSIREIVPVVRFDGRNIGAGKPGEITQRLMNAYSEATRCSS